MPARTHTWPDSHWSWPLKVTHKHGLRCGDMLHIGGQVALDLEGNVRHPNDLAAQTSAVMDYIHVVLEHLDAKPDDLVKLIAFYMQRDDEDPDRMLREITARLGSAQGPVISLVRLPELAYPDMVVEIEAVAMPGLSRTVASGEGLTPLPAPLSHAIRCGNKVYVGGHIATLPDGSVANPGELVTQSGSVMQQLGGLLTELGAGFDDVVKINRYYVGGGTAADWEGSALACASCFPEPGPAATGIPVPALQREGAMISLELTAMINEDGSHIPRDFVWPDQHWDWPTHLPYKHGNRCGNTIHVGGQVSLDPHGGVIDPADMVAQTKTSMNNIATVLDGFGAKMDDVVKVTTFYTGGASYDALHENFRIRSACFTDPGPATTGVPLPTLAYPDMTIEIEVVAMVD